MGTVKVNLGKRSYEIIVGNDLLGRAGELIRKRARLNHSSAVILTVPPVRELFEQKIKSSFDKAGIHSFFIEVPDTEKSKSLAQYSKVLNQLTKISKGGNSFFLVTLGGGVAGDLGGFAAATFKRGIPCVHIPTTLLAQVDSAIGGKTGIDLPNAKNMAGAVWQPSVVLSDVSVLQSLPEREFISGLGEVIKYGVIADEKLFRFLEQCPPKELQTDLSALVYLVTACSRCKAEFVKEDERDQSGKRALLNFGHTIGHAVESAIGYSKLYKHGEAISIGMVCAARISIALGLTHETLLSRLISLLEKTGLPVRLNPKVPVKKVLKNYLFDKKFSNLRTRFVLPLKIGRVVLKERIPERIVEEAVKACRS